jgi:hypothetical protein
MQLEQVCPAAATVVLLFELMDHAGLMDEITARHVLMVHANGSKQMGHPRRPDGSSADPSAPLCFLYTVLFQTVVVVDSHAILFHSETK